MSASSRFAFALPGVECQADLLQSATERGRLKLGPDMAERTLLLLADIAGYTEFMRLHRLNLAHSQEITQRLLESMQWMVAHNLCVCDACRRIGKLHVKFVAHVGEVVPQRIRHTEKLVGVDVIASIGC